MGRGLMREEEHQVMEELGGVWRNGQGVGVRRKREAGGKTGRKEGRKGGCIDESSIS